MRKTLPIAVLLLAALCMGIMASCNTDNQSAGHQGGESTSAVEASSADPQGGESTSAVDAGNVDPQGRESSNALEASGADPLGRGNSSAPEASSADDTAERYAAYSAKCQEYLAAFGAPSIEDPRYPTYFASGLALVRLLDFDGDGADEMLLAYRGSNAEQGVEVWTYRDGAAERLYAGTPSHHETNGGFTHVECLRRTDGAGALISTRHCAGSSPVMWLYELDGVLPDGSFGVVARRAYEQGGSTPGTTYYICPNEGDFYWNPDAWREVSEEEYQECFAAFGEELLHLHLFGTDPDSGIQYDCSPSLEDILKETEETINYLAEYAD